MLASERYAPATKRETPAAKKPTDTVNCRRVGGYDIKNTILLFYRRSSFRQNGRNEEHQYVTAIYVADEAPIYVADRGSDSETLVKALVEQDTMKNTNTLITVISVVEGSEALISLLPNFTISYMVSQYILILDQEDESQ
ncbi:unnamed protein product [Arabidopsis lyrata]|nr:unnamed protein product [Arabidopsis lyrata]